MKVLQNHFLQQLDILIQQIMPSVQEYFLWAPQKLQEIPASLLLNLQMPDLLLVYHLWIALLKLLEMAVSVFPVCFQVALVEACQK